MATGETVSGETLPRVLPVFLVNNKLPAFESKAYSTAEICAAIERKTGFNTIEGAQRIGGLWRIYPRDGKTRQKILIEGFVMRGVSVTVMDRNPFIVKTKDGEVEEPTTKLIISNIPLSVSDSDILGTIKGIATVRSQLIHEKDRDEKGRLTHWKTGRRFIYISLPKKPLPRQITISGFGASLYHKEQKFENKDAECRKCLQKGHTARTCINPIKCRQCFQDGHKAGDSMCSLCPSGLSQPPNENDNQAGGEKQQDVNNVTSMTEMCTDMEVNRSRERTRSIASKLGQLRRENRSRSEKRQRSPHGTTPPHADKQAKIRATDMGDIDPATCDSETQDTGQHAVSVEHKQTHDTENNSLC